MSLINVLSDKRILEYLHDELDLTQFSDGTYRCGCPIHHGDNKTSFVVYPSTNTWYCFSCNKGGDIFSYIMERDGVDFNSAVRTLCEFYNIDYSTSRSYQLRMSETQRNEKFCKCYEKNVGVVRDYLRNRGFTDETISEYRLGATADNSLIIPLLNQWNEVVGFTVRQFNKTPKYKHTPNSKESELFIKRKYWFNMNNARKLVKQKKRVYLVEGHLDAISINQMGEPALAYLGIVLSSEQCIELKKLFSHFGDVEIILVPDNDGKANKYVLKERDIFRKYWRDCHLRVLELNDEHCKDANDLLVAGKSISDFQTVGIDMYCLKYLVSQCSDIEQEYDVAQNFCSTISSQLIKSDIAKYLANRWKQELDTVKKHLNVTIEMFEEKQKNIHTVTDSFQSFVSRLDTKGIGVGYPKLDSNVTFRKQWVVILGAYSFSGKTNMLLEWILHWIMEEKQRVLFFSMEMPRDEIIELLIGKVFGIPPYEVKDIVKQDTDGVLVKLSEILNDYLYIVDVNSLGIDDIQTYIDVANSTHDKPVDIVCVDYYQYLKDTTEYTSDAKTARKMKEIAKKNDIALVMLSQFNKDSQKLDKGKFREPSMNDLKGAGDIGASADVIYLIWRPILVEQMGEVDREEKKYLTMLKVAKARRGLVHGVSHFELKYDIHTGRLVEV